MVTKGASYGLVALLTALLVISTTFALTYYAQYQQEVAVNNHQTLELQHFISKYGAVLESNLLIDFGNGTHHWYNGTQVQPGWNLYTLTLAVTNGMVNATCCAFGSHFVTGIDGVQDAPSKDKAWFNWTYNKTSLWQTASVGADQIGVYNDSVFAWTYCSYNPSTYATECPAGTP
jgi:hypothetical protein